MSSQPSLPLQTEVGYLREEVEDLRREVGRLRRELRSALQPRGTLSGISEGGSDSRDSRASDSRAEDSVPRSPTPSGYSYTSAGGSPEPERHSGERQQVPVFGGLQSVQTVPAANGPVSLSWIEREEICTGIGQFIARSLEGRHRGTSGREKIPNASKLWVIVRDYAGQIYTPVKVVRTWTSCRDLVKPGGQDPGDSIFVGLPSEREARRVVHAAGLTWPQAIEQ